MNSPNFPNSAFRLIMVLGYNGITDGSTYWTTICHWPNERHYDATSFSSCGCSFVLVLQDCECKTRSSTGFLRFSCCRHDSLRDDWYMFYGAQRGIDFLLLMSFPPTILFTFGKPSLLIWRWDRNSHGINVVLFLCCQRMYKQVKAKFCSCWWQDLTMIPFPLYKVVHFYMQLGITELQHDCVIWKNLPCCG